LVDGTEPVVASRAGLVFATVSPECTETGADGMLRSANVRTGEMRDIEPQAEALAASPSGRYLVTRALGCNAPVFILDTTTGSKHTISEWKLAADGALMPTVGLRSAAFIDETHVAVSVIRYNADGSVKGGDEVRLLDVASEQTIETAPTRFAKSLEVNIYDAEVVDGRAVLVVTTGTRPNHVRLFDANTGEEIRTLVSTVLPFSLWSADLDASGRYLLTTTYNADNQTDKVVDRWEDGVGTRLPGLTWAAWLEG